MTAKVLLKKLEKKGWELDRVRGSHHIMKKDGKTVVVALHSGDVPTGTLNKILKKAGLK